MDTSSRIMHAILCYRLHSPGRMAGSIFGCCIILYDMWVEGALVMPGWQSGNDMGAKMAMGGGDCSGIWWSWS